MNQYGGPLCGLTSRVSCRYTRGIPSCFPAYTPRFLLDVWDVVDLPCYYYDDSGWGDFHPQEIHNIFAIIVRLLLSSGIV